MDWWLLILEITAVGMAGAALALVDAAAKHDGDMEVWSSSLARRFHRRPQEGASAMVLLFRAVYHRNITKSVKNSGKLSSI